jgi:hypothetical protein
MLYGRTEENVPVSAMRLSSSYLIKDLPSRESHVRARQANRGIVRPPSSDRTEGGRRRIGAVGVRGRRRGERARFERRGLDRRRLLVSAVYRPLLGLHRVSGDDEDGWPARPDHVVDMYVEPRQVLFQQIPSEETDVEPGTTPGGPRRSSSPTSSSIRSASTSRRATSSPSTTSRTRSTR